MPSFKWTLPELLADKTIAALEEGGARIQQSRETHVPLEHQASADVSAAFGPFTVLAGEAPLGHLTGELINFVRSVCNEGVIIDVSDELTISSSPAVPARTLRIVSKGVVIPEVTPDAVPDSDALADLLRHYKSITRYCLN